MKNQTVNSIFDKASDLIEKDKYSEARKILLGLLRNHPDDALILTQIGLTYYEERKYKTALRYSIKAYDIAPYDPAILWDLAGTLQMLNHPSDALELYLQILHMGPKRAGTIECQEGVRWARKLLNDVRFRVAQCYLTLNEKAKAKRYLQGYIRGVKNGIDGLYSDREVQKLLARIDDTAK